MMRYLGLVLGLALLVGACAAPAPVGPPVVYVLTPAPPTSSPIPPSPTATITPRPTATSIAALIEPTLIASPNQPPALTLVAVGDVMLARGIGWQIENLGPDLIFDRVRPVFDQADLLVMNLETAIGTQGIPEPKAYTFRAPPLAIQALTSVGVDLVSLANNHAMDYGPLSLRETRQLLTAAGIASVGAGENATEARAPVILERNGLRVAFVSYVDVPVESGGFNTRTWQAGADKPGVAWLVLDDLRADIIAARQQADVVVALLHFGLEGRTEPWDRQQTAARAAIDAGAALVIGHHPHVLQPIEAYQGGLIVYSLGNFVFDGFTGRANDSAILSVTLTAAGVQDYEFTPVVIDDSGLPRLATEGEANRILPQLALP